MTRPRSAAWLPLAATVPALALALALPASAPAAGTATGGIDLMGFQFRPTLSSTQFMAVNQGETWCTSGDLPWFDAHIPLPDQVQITSVVLWGRVFANPINAIFYSHCTGGPAGSNPVPVMTNLLQITSPSSGSSFRTEQPLPTPVMTDTLRCTYQLRVNLNTCSAGQTLGRVRINYSH